MAQPLNEKTQQPQAIPSMSISTGSTPRNVKNLPFTNGRREWSHGLFDCFGDCGTCAFAWFCPWIVYAKNRQRVVYLIQNERSNPDVGGNGGYTFQMVTRSAIRNRYDIEGSTWGDFWTFMCCRPCALTQESREIGLEEQSLRVEALRA